jgi:hypothetical protein
MFVSRWRSLGIIGFCCYVVVMYVSCVLFSVFQSYCVSVFVVAVLVSVVPLVAVSLAIMVSVAVCPLFRFPMFHCPVVVLYVPCVVVVLVLGSVSTVSPVGSRSVSDIAVVLLGPLLVVVMVMVT